MCFEGEKMLTLEVRVAQNNLGYSNRNAVSFCVL
jgi:hypothetical protein